MLMITEEIVSSDIYKKLNDNIDKYRKMTLEELMVLRSGFEMKEKFKQHPLAQFHLRIIQLELDARYGRSKDDFCILNPQLKCNQCGGCER